MNDQFSAILRKLALALREDEMGRCKAIVLDAQEDLAKLAAEAGPMLSGYPDAVKRIADLQANVNLAVDAMKELASGATYAVRSITGETPDPDEPVDMPALANALLMRAS